MNVESTQAQSRQLAEIRFADARLGELLESMPDAIVVASASGSIALVNSQAERLFGYERGELLGLPVEVLLPPRFRQRHLEHRGNYARQPHTRAMGAGLELYGVRKDGREFPVEISLSPLATDEGHFVSSAIRDVTQSKLIQQALRDKNTELENAARVKDRFLANMSHELRTPLNAIIGFTGTLLMRLPGPLTPDQESQLTTIQSSARHLHSLINDLLDLAKIEAGRVELLLEPVSAAEVLDELAALLRPAADAKGIAFAVETPAVGTTVRTDRRALTQILLNLTNNAIKFTDVGSVAVALHQSGPPGAQVTTFRIRDTGPGISADDQRNLFQSFRQLGARTARRNEGAGLGLHLSQKLAQMLNGEIRCESEPGKGSLFELRLTERAA